RSFVDPPPRSTAISPLSLHDALPSLHEELQQAVASIESPLFVGRTLGELGLVRSVSKKLTGKAKVELTLPVPNPPGLLEERLELDRKSTRLNSSHVKISYAVFCLKKK